MDSAGPPDVEPFSGPPLLSPAAVQHAIRIGPRAAPTSFPHITLPAELRTAVVKRQVLFLAGRHCAAVALDQLRGATECQQIDREPSGGPRWPAGITGSITHTAGIARAAVAWTSDVAAIGIDTEHIAADERALRLAPTILGEAERRMARRHALGPGAWITLAFSAKESLFKCLYPAVGRYFHYTDASIQAVRDDGVFEIRLDTTLTADYAAGLVLAGTFRIEGRAVHTAICLSPSAVPSRALA